MITIAIAKGRMQDDALALLAHAGVRLSDEALASRRLALIDESGEYRFIFVKLAAVLGLADLIVDLVETGRTLKDNGLTIVEVITESTGRLVVNRASYQLKASAITTLINALEATINGATRA